MIPKLIPIPQQESLLTDFIQQLPLKSLLQRVPGLLLISCLVVALLPMKFPFIFSAYFIILHMVLLSQTLRTAYATHTGYHSAVKFSKTNWLTEYCRLTSTSNGFDANHDLPLNHIIHVIIIPNYKEDLNTICETLDLLASHSKAQLNYRVCLAMEESEINSSQKAESLLDVYTSQFFDLCYTVHPKGRDDEIRGKSSNVSWASIQMAKLGGHIMTVMDADTGFAQDYFESIAFYYTTSTPSERAIMMFCPCSVFDRNAKDVPMLVRVTDLFWSIGVMSNMYPNSPIKIPSSAYSVSVELAIAVNFWDCGPEAIGEDMHMYLKCYFQTNGQVIVKSIYSPISSCNIEGNGKSTSGYVSGLYARYTQAKRHLWGSLDTGYVFRRSFLSLFSDPTTVNVKNSAAYQTGKDTILRPGIQFKSMITLWHRMIEAHIFMGHLFPLLIVSSFIIPSSNPSTFDFLHDLKIYMWFLVAGPVNVHPILELCILYMGWLRFLCLFPTLITWIYYEKYHQYVGFDRWDLQSQVDDVPSGYVQRLGRRPTLRSPRGFWSALDWLSAGPAGFLFYILPMFHAQLSHLFTDRLEYQVAAKPILPPRLMEIVVSS